MLNGGTDSREIHGLCYNSATPQAKLAFHANKNRHTSKKDTQHTVENYG